MVLSVLKHVLEFFVNHGNLSIGQSVSFSIDQALDCGKLIDEHELWIVSMEVNSFEISSKKRIIEDWAASLVHLHVKDGAANLEKVLDNIIRVVSKGLQIGLNQQILLRFLKEGIKLFVLLFEIGIGIKEMKSLHNVDEVNFSSQVLSHEECVLVLLVEMS